MTHFYLDNLTLDCTDEETIDIIKEYISSGRIADDYLPFDTYDMVQSGYPMCDHGTMVQRYLCGTNEKNQLCKTSGMWCKVSEIEKILKEKEETINKLQNLVNELIQQNDNNDLGLVYL